MCGTFKNKAKKRIGLLQLPILPVSFRVASTLTEGIFFWYSESLCNIQRNNPCLLSFKYLTWPLMLHFKCCCQMEKCSQISILLDIFLYCSKQHSLTPNAHPHASFQQHPLWWQLHSLRALADAILHPKWPGLENTRGIQKYKVANVNVTRFNDTDSLFSWSPVEHL